MCPRALPLLLVIMGVLPCSKAQQYDLRNFELEQGLPSNTVKALCEDQEGFLWIATDEGVARSEGSHFQVLGTENGSPENDVTELYCAPDGAVWMGYRRGSIALWRHGRISTLRARSSAQAAVSGITSDSGGVTWVATQDGGIERFAMDGSSLGTANLDRAGARINALCTDHQGRVVAGTD
ncbi:MAG: hypothetical protein KDB84_10745, partial [Flavobacteriales bacterium]|nr:hypothetical protein [Flavobacteriales bacterium]